MATTHFWKIEVFRIFIPFLLLNFFWFNFFIQWTLRNVYIVVIIYTLVAAKKYCFGVNTKKPVFPYLPCTFDATFYSSAIAAKPNGEAPPPVARYGTMWHLLIFHRALNLRVVGSSPTLGDISIMLLNRILLSNKYYFDLDE